MLLNEKDLLTTTGNGELLYRWNGHVFNELVLPNGKVIVTDPYQYGVKNPYVPAPHVQAGDWVRGCDYVLITHIHSDHIRDLPYLLQKYPDCEVVVPALSAIPMLMEYDLHHMKYRFQLVSENDRLEFPDFTLECFLGKHNLNMEPKGSPFYAENIPYREQPRMQDADGNFCPIKTAASISGTLDMINYRITTKEGYSILIWGGILSSEHRRFHYRGTKPDLMLNQLASANIGGDRDHPVVTDMGDFLAEIQPKLIMPEHHEKFTWENLESVGRQVVERVNACGKDVDYFNPIPGKWYVLKDGIQRLKE